MSSSPTTEIVSQKSSTSIEDRVSSHSIESSQEIIAKEPPHTKFHRRIHKKKHKNNKQSCTQSTLHKKFDGNKSCTSKILGIRRRKDISGPPLVSTVLYNSRSQINRKLERFNEITRENARLVHRITSIYTKGGGIDNRLEEFPSVSRPAWFRHHKIAQTAAENYYIYRRLQNIKPITSRHDQLVWYAEQEEHMERISKYPMHLNHLPCFSDRFYKHPIPGKAYACLEIGYGKKLVETENLVMELLTQYSPATCVNFLVACENTNNEFSLRGKSIDKLVSISTSPSKFKRAYWKLGASTEIQQKDEHCMKTEENKLKHTEAGLLTRPLKIATGEFYITIGPSPFLDGKCCVFGRLIGDSMAFLNKMEKENVDVYGNPLFPMVIMGCRTASSVLDIYMTDQRGSGSSEENESHDQNLAEREEPVKEENDQEIEEEDDELENDEDNDSNED